MPLQVTCGPTTKTLLLIANKIEFCLKKGSWLASFFIALSFFSNLTWAVPDAALPRWQALLHLKDGAPQITDPAFILSGVNFSPELEWKITRAMFRQHPASICRFPARYQLISAYESLPQFPDCPEYSQFLNKVPIDDISVIYASENLSNPTSMMGHGMLSVSGLREDGYQANHAVSFFTEMDSYNPLKVIWETLIVGKDGFFLVKPLRSHVDFYNQQEQRNVWRYVLALTPEQKQLVQAHLWELRYAQIPYFFDDHNCATLSLDILRLAKPDLPQPDLVSPLDLAKIVNQNGLVKRTEMTPADKWKIRTLNELAPEAISNAAEKFRRTSELPELATGEQRFLFKQLSQALLNFDQSNARLSQEKYRSQQQLLAEYQADRLFLDPDHYRSPLNTPEDSQLAAGLLRYQDSNWMSLRWLPAAHTLEDDNREYFGENELRLNEIELRLSPSKHALQLHRWQIYSAASLTPHDSLIGGLSGRFQLGFQPVYNYNLQANTGLNISGGAGITQAIGSDMRVYALFNLGADLSPLQSVGYLQPEVGAYLYEVFDMKSRFSYQPQLRSDGRMLQRWSLSHSLSWKHSAVVAKAEWRRISSSWHKNWQLEWRWYY